MSFSTVQPRIRQWVEDDPRRAGDVILFASLSIRQPFYHMKRQMSSVRTHGSKSPYLFGFKRSTYEWLDEHTSVVSSLYETLNRLTDSEGLGIISTIPGIGLAKAGFVMQMLKGTVGCLDTHNLALYKDTIRDIIKSNPKGIFKDNPKYKYIFKDYNNTKGNPLRGFKWEPLGYTYICNTLGSEFLWDEWCKHISVKYPQHFMSSTNVSEFHLECLKCAEVSS
jgi:hypothetical protein